MAHTQVSGDFGIADADIDEATSAEPEIPETIADELCIRIRQRLASGHPKAALAAASELLTVIKIAHGL